VGIDERKFKGVFLSYPSQDAEAARRAWDAQHDAGGKSWFDRSELVGGAESGLACKIEMEF
jgi:hypothetical protein